MSIKKFKIIIGLCAAGITLGGVMLGDSFNGMIRIIKEADD